MWRRYPYVMCYRILIKYIELSKHLLPITYQSCTIVSVCKWWILVSRKKMLNLKSYDAFGGFYIKSSVKRFFSPIICG